MMGKRQSSPSTNHTMKLSTRNLAATIKSLLTTISILEIKVSEISITLKPISGKEYQILSISQSCSMTQSPQPMQYNLIMEIKVFLLQSPPSLKKINVSEISSAISNSTKTGSILSSFASRAK